MTTIIRDGSLAGQIPDIPHFLPVAADVFEERAQRFAALADGSSLASYLRFAAALSAAQHAVLRSLPDLPLPSASTLAHCREHGMPPLSIDGHRRDPLWREALGQLLSRVDRSALPARGAATVDELRGVPTDELERTADRLLTGVYSEPDAAEAPFVAAALQVYWVKLAQQLGDEATHTPPQVGSCPVCGSPPVASVVRIGAARQGLRYLVCSLCCSEWHMVRIKCSACASTKGVTYLGVEGGGEAIKAECCDECRTYLKIFYQEKDTGLVPAADDLASLSLDMLVDREGYNRIGPNLLFVPGDSSRDTA